MMIEADKLSYRYDPAGREPVLRDIDFSVAAGEYALLCGASGSGKSTLCRALNGLIPHFHGGRLEGRLVVDGLETQEHPVHELFAHAGLIFQNPDAQLFNSTVERELAFGLESLGLSVDEIRRRVAWAADVIGLEHLMDRRPVDLSGGEKQLVAIGAMLALRPPLLVLDEPYANLDPAAAARIRDVLCEINDLGTTIILAEHRLHDIVADVDRMMVLYEGRIALNGPPREVLLADVSDYGLTEPYVVRWGKAQGLAKLPLSADEALQLVRQAGVARSGDRPQQEVVPQQWSGGRPQQEVVPQQWSGDRPQQEVVPQQWSGGRPQRRSGDRPQRGVVEVMNVSHHFDGEPALEDVTLEVRRGECLALVGANGSGKTTLIKHFNGLYKPDRGQITVLGRDTRQVPTSELAQHVGIVFQNPNDQFFRSTVHEEIMAGPQALSFSDSGWHDILVDLFKLQPYLKRSPYRLSEGEKKRVAFASTLATRPEIFVLDEPTTGQDRHFRESLRELLDQLRHRHHTVVLVTHDLEFASAVADRWAVLAGGRLIANGDPEAIMADPAVMAKASLQPTEEFRLRQALSEQAREVAEVV